MATVGKTTPTDAFTNIIMKITAESEVVFVVSPLHGALTP